MPYPIPRSFRLKSTLFLSVAGLQLFLPAGVCAQEPTFRIRSDLAVPLNADAGWAGEVGEIGTVEADRPFRLRVESEAVRSGEVYSLQARRNENEWKTLDAYDFPHPQRELKIDFDDETLGKTPLGWSVQSGTPDNIFVVHGDSGKLLRFLGGSSGLEALFAAPWPLADFAFETRFKLPEGDKLGFSIVLGHADSNNAGYVDFATDGHISFTCLIDGKTVFKATEATIITPGIWHSVQMQFENGKLEVELDDKTPNFEAPTCAFASDGSPGIFVPPNGHVDLDDLVVEGVARTPGISIVTAGGFSNAEQTTDLLTGSTAPFIPAFGLSLTDRTPAWRGKVGAHGEFEWPLVIRRFGDGPLVNKTGDQFQFRMIDSTGEPLLDSATAQVNLVVSDGHLGGTFIETPGRIGPWQARNGDLYFLMEPTETDNKFMMMKSSDGGKIWIEVDGANRPLTGDLESVDSRLIEDRIHIIHQVTHSVRYHVFRTSDHATHPDSWEIRDEVAARATAIAQTATMAVRSDDSITAFFLADRLHYNVRKTDGRWSDPIELDRNESFINTGPQAILGKNDIVHLAYSSDDGSIWYRRLLPTGKLTRRQRLAIGAGTSRAEYGAVLPLGYDSEADTVIIAYRLADGSLWERRATAGAQPSPSVRITERRVITDAVDSQQPAADIIMTDATTDAIFVGEETRSLYSSQEIGGRWTKPLLRVQNIKGSWVRGNIIEKPDGSHVYGYVYDAGSEGGSGLNRYAEFPVDGN